MPRGIAIVGAGHGGSQAAASLRQSGYDGPVYLVSGEPDLPYHKPPLSKAFLKDAAVKPQPLRAEQFYRDNAIELCLGVEVRAIDRQRPQLELGDGKTLSVDHIILAVGARARLLPLPGNRLDGVWSLRTLSDAMLLREAAASAAEVVVIGGGFIGLEAAATLAARGSRVTVIEATDRLLGRAVSEPVSTHMRRYHEGLGIEIRTSMRIEALVGKASRVVGVTTVDGRHHAADMVVVGIGAEPAVELALDAGIDCANGVTVDALLRSARPDILAIGDCASFPHWQAARMLRLESVQNAADQARHAARTIAGHSDPYRDVAWFWSDQGDVKLQMAGVAFDDDRRIISGSPDDRSFSVFRFRGDTLLAVESVNRPAEHMIGRRLIAQGYSPSLAEITSGPHHLKQVLELDRQRLDAASG